MCRLKSHPCFFPMTFLSFVFTLFPIGMFRQTLLGYAMGETSGPGVSKVNCIVSLVLSMNSEERLRELTQVFRSINEVRESMEVHIDYVGHRITTMQKGWRG